jgi:hypothetical protein
MVFFVAFISNPRTSPACPYCTDATPANLAGHSSVSAPVRAASSPFNASIEIILVGFFAGAGIVGGTLVKAIRSSLPSAEA